MRLPIKSKLAYSSASIGDAASYCIVGTFLMFFLTTVVHINPAVAGTIIGLGSMWDAIWSLLIGFWSDRNTSKMGRRRPFILIGGTLIMICCSLMFLTIHSIETLKIMYYAVVVLVFWTGFSTFYVPFLALGVEFTDDYNERTRLRSFAYGFNILGTFIGIVFPSVIVDFFCNHGLTLEGAWHATGTLVGIASGISIYITVFLSKPFDTTKERVVDLEQKKEAKITFRLVMHHSCEILKDYISIFRLKPFRFLLAASIFYLIANTIVGADRLYFYTYNLGLSPVQVTAVLVFASINGIFFSPIVTGLTKWFDKRTLLILMMMLSAALVTGAKFTGIATFSGMLIFTFVFAISNGAYWQLIPSMLYDICEYDELHTGKRREGSIVSLQSVSEAFAGAIAMQTLGIVLQLAGFDGTIHHQTESALSWVENMLTVIPAIFMIATTAMIFLYPITKIKYEEIKVELSKRSQI